MTMRKQPKFYAEPIKAKRSDFALNINIANAIIGVVMSGQDLYPQGGLELAIPDETNAENRQKTVRISRGTLNSWITRRNVIPETGETLHAVLERAKREYRIKEIEERKVYIVNQSLKILSRLLKLRTNQPVRNIFGHTIQREDGSLIRRENVPLLKLQADTVKYLLERLEPETFGKHPEKVQTYQFSLADLRREQERQDKEKAL